MKSEAKLCNFEYSCCLYDKTFYFPLLRVLCVSVVHLFALHFSEYSKQFSWTKQPKKSGAAPILSM